MSVPARHDVTQYLKTAMVGAQATFADCEVCVCWTSCFCAPYHIMYIMQVVFCGTRLRLHRVILASCPFFEAAFTSPLGAKNASDPSCCTVNIDTDMICPNIEALLVESSVRGILA